MTIEVGSGGGGLPQLAPDLTAPASWLTTAKVIKITGIDSTTGGLVTILSIPADKGNIPYLQLENSAGSFTIKLTVDGVVIWNDVWVSPASNAVLIGGAGSTTLFAEAIPFNTSFLLECTGTDDNFNVKYMKRPTL